MNEILFYGVPVAFAAYAIKTRFFKTVYLLFAVIFGVYFGLYWSFPASLVTILDDKMLVNYKKVIAVGMTGFAVFFLLNRIFYNSLASRKLFNFPHAPDKIMGALCGYLAGSVMLNFVVFVFTMTPFTDMMTTFSPDLLRDNSLKNMERVTMCVNYASFQGFDREKCEKYLISLRPAPPEPEQPAKPAAPATPAAPAKPTAPAKPAAPTAPSTPNAPAKPGTATNNTNNPETPPPAPQQPPTRTPIPTVKPTPPGEEIVLKTQRQDTNIQLKTQPKTKVDIKI